MKGSLWEESLAKFGPVFNMLDYLKRLFVKPVVEAKPVILVIAESKMTQEALLRDFESLGCKVVSAITGQIALKSLEMGPLPDVIILDFIISDEDGPTLYRRFAQDKRYSSIPVVPLPFSTTGELVPGITKKLYNVPDCATEITITPSELFLSVGHALSKTNIKLPNLFRVKLRNLIQSMTEPGVKNKTWEET